MKLSASGLVTAAILGAAFAVGSVINSYLPSRSEILLEPFAVAGAIEQPVQIRTGTVTASNVRAASQVDQFLASAQTTGVFMLVDLVYDTNGLETAVFPITWIDADGTEYGGMQPGARANRCGGGQVGIPVTCTLWFELPTDAVAGGSLAVYASAASGGDSFAVIDLQISDEQAADLIANAEPAEPQPARFEGP